MDQDSAHMVAASKVPMLKPGEYEIWRMRIEQYIQMIDYALWEVIEKSATLPKTTMVEGVITVMPITTAEEKAQRRLEVKARSTLMIGIPNEHQLNFNSIKDAKKLLEVVKRDLLELLDEKLSQEDVNKKLLRSLSPEWNTHAVVWRNKADLDTMSMDDLYNNLKHYKAVNTAHGVSTASTQVNAATTNKLDNLSDVVICAFFASQPNSPQLVHEDLQQIHPDDMEEMDLRWQMAMLTMRARRFLKNTGRKLTINGNEDYCDQAEEGPNYALMAFSSSSPNSKVSNDSTCSKTCLETVELLKSQNDQLLRDLKKSELIVLGYKIDKFEHASDSLNKLIESQIVDNCKKGLGYENYNAVPPPYIGNFMPPTPDLYFISLDEFVNKLVVENYKAISTEEEPRVVRKNDDAPIIEEWVSDDDEEDVSQPKIEKKTVRPNSEFSDAFHQRGVLQYLCLVEFAYNNSWHASIKAAPFELLYGRKCRAPICWDEVGERLIEGPELIEITNEKVVVAKEKLKEARSRQKSYADKHRRDLEFQVGDRVFLKVSPFRGVKRFGIKGKLSPRFIGPFEILERIGEVSYRLALPPQLSHVHDVFHVSLLRGYHYHPLHVASYPFDQIQPDMSLSEEPESILDRQERVMRNKVIPFVKILWKNHPEREATWETEESMRASYPHFFV
ncbi:ribonuclease H-like domain-containing protein [Tanacetum coccineum]